MSCMCRHRHWHKRETAKAAWCPEHGVYLHARGLPFQGKRRKRNGYVDLAPRPLIAAANVKTRRSKLLLDLGDAHRRCIAVLNALVYRAAERVDQTKPAVATHDAPAHGGFFG